METQFYVASNGITNRIQNTVIEGEFIDFNGYRYKRVHKRPVGKRIFRRLRGIEDSNITLLLYN